MKIAQNGKNNHFWRMDAIRNSVLIKLVSKKFSFSLFWPLQFVPPVSLCLVWEFCYTIIGMASLALRLPFKHHKEEKTGLARIFIGNPIHLQIKGKLFCRGFLIHSNIENLSQICLMYLFTAFTNQGNGNYSKYDDVIPLYFLDKVFKHSGLSQVLLQDLGGDGQDSTRRCRPFTTSDHAKRPVTKFVLKCHVFSLDQTKRTIIVINFSAILAWETFHLRIRWKLEQLILQELTGSFIGRTWTFIWP